MKYILLVSLFPLYIVCSGQNETPLKFSEVISVDSVSKEQLFYRARSWFSTFFKSANDVLSISDKESGELSGKGAFKFDADHFIGSGAVEGYVRYHIRIWVKDGRFKYEVTNFVHESSALTGQKYSFGLLTEDKDFPWRMTMVTKSWKNSRWNEIKRDAVENTKQLILSLRSNMEKDVSNSDNW